MEIKLLKGQKNSFCLGLSWPDIMCDVAGYNQLPTPSSPCVMRRKTMYEVLPIQIASIPKMIQCLLTAAQESWVELASPWTPNPCR